MRDGKSATEYCRDVLNVPYSVVIEWLRSDPGRSQKYDQAINDRNEHVAERVLAEIRALAFTKMTEAFNDDGTIKPVSEWGEDLCRGLAYLEVTELFKPGTKKVQIGVVKKMKFHPKLQALEMAAKNLQLLTQKVEVQGQLTLEALVNESMRTDRKLIGE